MTTLASEFKQVENLFRVFPVLRARCLKLLDGFSKVTHGRQSLPMELLISLSALLLPILINGPPGMALTIFM